MSVRLLQALHFSAHIHRPWDSMKGNIVLVVQKIIKGERDTVTCNMQKRAKCIAKQPRNEARQQTNTGRLAADQR